LRNAAFPCRGASPPHARRRALFARRSAPGDAVDSWLDLSSFVTGGGGGTRTPYDALADKIGRDVYVDIQGWHLYLKDARVPGAGLSLAQALAQKIGPTLSRGGRFSQADAEALLRRVPLALGGGKAKLPLLDALPAACVADFIDAVVDFERGM
jgi:hypothetical protein